MAAKYRMREIHCVMYTKRKKIGEYDHREQETVKINEEIIEIIENAVNCIFEGSIPCYIYPSHQSGRRDVLWVPFINECHLTGPRGRTFSATLPIFWKSSLEFRLTMTLMIFQKALNTWLCQHTWKSSYDSDDYILHFHLPAFLFVGCNFGF